MRLTRTGLAAIVLCATAVLTGCGPRFAAAKVGMTVDDSGNPVIVLEDCKEGDMVELQLFDESLPAQPNSTGGTTTLPIAVYTASKGSKSVRQIPVRSGGDGWKPVTVVNDLSPRTSYKVRSWGEDHQSFGGQTIFTPNDLKTLTPGEVRYGVQVKTASGVYEDQYRVSPLDEFNCD
ncbi:hypothetical protein [Kribbella italica]|uniref:Lipoprotein n=1 Tax=Kribbella italica TaxID=1540520 RepID=A0A7W9MXC6_9ACTN|nr:hypothetical protein [Kribbella italica]MBB5839609.1 hypothetical protein [Kribbella italica]